MSSITRLTLDYPRLSSFILLVLFGLGLAGVAQLETRTGYRAIMGDNDPDVVRLDRFIGTFAGGLPIVLAWGCDLGECPHALTPPQLAKISRIASRMRETRGVREIRSPHDTAIVVPTADSFQVRRLRESGKSPQDADHLVSLARKDPMWREVLISADGMTAAMLIELESSDPATYEHVVMELTERVEAAGLVPYALVGDPVDFVFGGGELNKEAKRIGVGAFAVVLFVIAFLFRSIAMTLAGASAIIFSVVAALGIMGWLGWPENEISQTLVPVLLVVGACDVIHFLSAYRDGSTNPNRKQRLLNVTTILGKPCFVTSAATTAGLGCFAISDLYAFETFAIAAFVGIAAAFAYTFTGLPLLLSSFSIDGRPAERQAEEEETLVSVLASTPRNNWRAILVGAGLAALLIGSGVARLTVDVSKESLVGILHPTVQWYNWVQHRLGPSESTELVLHSPHTLGEAGPEITRVLSETSDALERDERFGSATSVVVMIDIIGRAFTGNNTYAVTPTTQAEVDQLVSLVESSSSVDLDAWVDQNSKSSFRIRVTTSVMSKLDRLDAIERIESILTTLPEGWSYELTGPMPLYASMLERTQDSQLASFGTAVVLISLIIFLATRSLVDTLACVFVTCLPILINLGIVGWANVTLDTGTAMIGAAMLGIAVDDAVYLLFDYRRRRRAGAPRGSAIEKSVLVIGRPILATSASLSLGFFVLTASTWSTVSLFGFLSSMIIVAAGLTDLLVLPALIFLRDEWS